MAKTSSPSILNFLSYCFISICGGYAVWSLFRIMLTTAPDFAFYYGSVPSLLPPPSRVLYLPLRLLPFRIMEIMWVLGSLLLLIDVIRRTARRMHIRSISTIALIVCIAFLMFPTRFTLGMGQVNIIALWILVRSWEQPTPLRSGILFALSVLLKPELIFLILPIACIGKWKMVTASIGTFVLFSGFAVLLWGTQAYRTYTPRMTSVFSDISGLAIYYNQSITGLLSRIGAWNTYIYVVLCIVLTGLSIRTIVRLQHQDRDLGLWFFMPTFILIEPIAWQHHLVFLIPTYCFVWSRIFGTFKKILFVLSVVLVGWNFTNPSFLDTMPVSWLALSHGTVGIFILWGLLLGL